MDSLIDLEIYAWISRYLRGVATVDDFEDWFVSATWEVERTGNIRAVEVADPVLAALTELSAAEIDEDEFRGRLQSLENQRRERIRIFQAFVEARLEPLSETKTVDITIPASV